MRGGCRRQWTRVAVVERSLGRGFMVYPVGMVCLSGIGTWDRAVCRVVTDFGSEGYG